MENNRAAKFEATAKRLTTRLNATGFFGEVVVDDATPTFRVVVETINEKDVVGLIGYLKSADTKLYPELCPASNDEEVVQ
jgi:hypothetical protein